MKNKKGFTLTELIAVIVIIGIILLITIPAMNNIMMNNNQEKYMLYVETVEKALFAYADLELPTTVEGEKKVSLQDLINNNYLKTFNENGVTVPNTEFKITKINGKVTITVPSDFKLEFKKDGETVYNCSKAECSS